LYIKAIQRMTFIPTHIASPKTEFTAQQKKTIKKDVTIYLDYILCAAKTAILKQNMFMQVPFSLDQQPLATESQSVLPILSYR
jgi:hypothetical protein